jgi:hypothetical protein
MGMIYLHAVRSADHQPAHRNERARAVALPEHFPSGQQVNSWLQRVAAHGNVLSSQDWRWPRRRSDTARYLSLAVVSLMIGNHHRSGTFDLVVRQGPQNGLHGQPRPVGYPAQFLVNRILTRLHYHLGKRLPREWISVHLVWRDPFSLPQRIHRILPAAP